MAVETASRWPLVSAVYHGVSRDAFMARHRAYHVNIAYAAGSKSADQALALKAAMFHALGVTAHLCGDVVLN
jgi:hypothetical protein